MHAATPQVLPVSTGAQPLVPGDMQTRLRGVARNAESAARPVAWCDSLLPIDAGRLFAAAGRVVLVAPRPGDGLAAAAGFVAAAARHGLPVWAWVLTDGTPGAAVPADAPWRSRLDAALDALGVRSGGIERFRLPAGVLQAHRDPLEGCFRRLLQPGDVVLAPRPAAAGCDDAAVAHAVAAAASCSGCVRLGFAPHTAWPARPGPASGGWRRLELDPELVARKRAAARAFGLAGGAIAPQAPATPRADVEILAPG